MKRLAPLPLQLPRRCVDLVLLLRVDFFNGGLSVVRIIVPDYILGNQHPIVEQHVSSTKSYVATTLQEAP